MKIIHRNRGRQALMIRVIILLIILLTTASNFNVFSNHILYQVRELDYYNIDSAYVDLEKRIKRGVENGDTLTYLKAIQLQSKIAKYKGLYHQAYELSWLLLKECDSAKFPRIIASTYTDLGYMYGTYMQYDLSKEYHEKSLAINQELVENGKLEESELTHNYYALASYYKKTGDFKYALNQLSKCSKLNKKHNLIQENSGFVDAESGDCYLQLEVYDSAEYFLLRSLAYFEKQKSKASLYSLIHLYLGNLYFELEDMGIASKYFQRTIEIADSMQIGDFLKRDALSKLAEINFLKKNYKKAFEYQKEEKAIGDSLFGVLNTHNGKLFKIRNNYREETERIEALMQSQELVVLRQKQSLYILRMRMVVVIVGGIITILLLFLYFQKKKSKQVINQQMEILQVKNKELTGSSLKMIETNELIAQLKSDIESYNGKAIPKATLRSITHGLSVNTKNNWKEFELRFTAVNQEFYNKLLSKFPSLSPNELKICAMLKLGLTGQDMANLMGISLKSVHTARYRMRKKMQLDAETDLQEYIYSF